MSVTPLAVPPSRPRRERVVLLALLLCGLVVGARLFTLQIVEHDALFHLAQKQSLSFQEIPGPRGDIYDRNGSLLAISSPVKALACEPEEMTESELRALERTVGLRPGALLRHKESAWRVVKRECDRPCESAVASAIAKGELKKESLHWQPAYSRSYPMGSLAAQTIGFINVEGHAEGVERSYDRILAATGRRVTFSRDARMKTVEVIDTGGDYASLPTSLMLTIDARIQRKLEEELAAAIERHGAQGAQGIVLDPHTGDVLAMASLPSFDPNEFGRALAGTTRNRVVGAAYEQGSVLKPLVAAAIVEAGLYRPGATVHCENGSWTTNGRTISDVEPHGALTLPEVLQESSNIGIVKFARPLEAKRLHDVFRRLGLGSRTGIDLPAESPGLLRDAAEWKPIEKDSASFGYYLSATPLQMAVAYATLATGGIRPTPRIVRAFGSPSGSWHAVAEKPKERALETATARLVTGWLVDVIEAKGATGTHAKVPGYLAAGKTGTAWIIGREGYDRRRMRASFAGFAPASNPVAVIVIGIEEPVRNGWGGGAVAAPVFREVMAETLRLRRVPLDEPLEEDAAEPAQVASAPESARRNG